MHPAVTLPVRLRPVTADDHAVLGAMRADIALQHMLLANPPRGGDPDVAGWAARREASGRLWAIADAETDACLGFVQLSDVHRKNALGWLGLALAPQARGRGLGQAAMASLEVEARRMGLRKLLLQVRTDNRQAIALYERAGYAPVGVLRRHYDDGERLHDVLVMERLLA
jgi:RimJ/RimL family protein N-acetyltransferase